MYLKNGETSVSVFFNTTPAYLQQHNNCLFQGSTHECIDGKSVLQQFPKSLIGQKITLEFDGKTSILSYDRLTTLKAWRDNPPDFPYHIQFFDDPTNIIQDIQELELTKYPDLTDLQIAGINTAITAKWLLITNGTKINVSFDYSMESPIDMQFIDENKVMCSGKIHLIRV
jgi:hypothetical protein